MELCLTVNLFWRKIDVLEFEFEFEKESSFKYYVYARAISHFLGLHRILGAGIKDKR